LTRMELRKRPFLLTWRGKISRSIDA
jgi:hypothetical protein